MPPVLALKDSSSERRSFSARAAVLFALLADELRDAGRSIDGLVRSLPQMPEVDQSVLAEQVHALLGRPSEILPPEAP